MIAASILAYDHDTPFPGLAAVPPVAGTALVILFATPGTLAARLLSAGPMRGIGLISYSAYLWHQPLFAFTRLRSLGEPPPLLMGGLVLLTLVLAWITWRWVERPFRRGGRVFATRRGVLGAAAAGGVAMVLVGAVVGPLSAGFPGRFPTAALLYAEAAGAGAGGPCHFDENRPLDRHPQPQCRHPDAAGNVSVLLLGDSHANALEHAVGEGLRRAETGYYAVSFGGCIPLPGFRRMRDSPSPDACHEFDEAALDYAAATGIRTVILAGRFPLYLYGKRFDNGAGGVEKGDNGAVDVIAPDAAPAAARTGCWLPSRRRSAKSPGGSRLCWSIRCPKPGGTSPAWPFAGWCSPTTARRSIPPMPGIWGGRRKSTPSSTESPPTRPASIRPASSTRCAMHPRAPVSTPTAGRRITATTTI